MARRPTPRPIPFTNGFYESSSRPMSAQRCINWRPAPQQSQALNPEGLFPSTGIDGIVSGTGVGRGSIRFKNKLYVVCDHTLYRIDRSVAPDGTESYSKVSIGTIAGSDDVIMASDDSWLSIVNPDPTATTAGNAYRYDGTTLTDITSTANFLSPAITVVSIDGYFVFAQYATNVIFHCDVGDLTTFDALNYWQVIQYPENKALVVYQNNLYALGESITVPFSDQEEPDFAFRPIPNSVIDVGAIGSYSVQPTNDSIAIIGSGENDGRAVYLFSSQMSKISTDAVDVVLQNQTPEVLAKAKILHYAQNGASFIVIRFGDWCFSYDLVSQKWSENRSRIYSGESYLDAPWRAKSITQAYNRVFVTDSVDGVGLLSDSLGTEYGEVIYREVVLQPFTNNLNRTRVASIEILCDVGNAEGQKLELSWSDDGGFNFVPVMYRDIGSSGEYKRRIVFSCLGAFPVSRMVKIRFSGTKSFAINAIYASFL